MLLSSTTTSVDEAELLVFSKFNGTAIGGSLVSLRPNSSGVFEARVNPMLVQDFKLEEAFIFMTSLVNDTSTGLVQVSMVFSLGLSNTTLGGHSVIVHALVFVATSHDTNGTEHRHDQIFFLKYIQGDSII